MIKVGDKRKMDDDLGIDPTNGLKIAKRRKPSSQLIKLDVSES